MNLTPLPRVIDQSFIPHEGLMKLVDRWVGYDAAMCQIKVNLQVDGSKPYWNRERQQFSGVWYTEIMAQAVATLYRIGLSRDGVRWGYLIAIDHYQHHPGPLPKPGDLLMVEATLICNFHPFGKFKTQVYLMNQDQERDPILVASATMKFLVDESTKGIPP